ncbi:hypothetical protein FRUB_05865 [Fimbriiglobus ruber]|uniref:Uncharacterized protein n=1 Tax=Fimbriiglobus ruber TaxID=1908690 RepID=A0A225DU94_9BACT|nr:hypothetical protein FRUB_05865 [Fimbriiglobus ruber]
MAREFVTEPTRRYPAWEVRVAVTAEKQIGQLHHNLTAERANRCE